jgi:hypothetical protein
MVEALRLTKSTAGLIASANGGEADIAPRRFNVRYDTKRTFLDALLRRNTRRIFAPFNGELIACHFRAHLP